MARIKEIDNDVVGNIIKVPSVRTGKTLNCEILGMFKVNGKDTYVALEDQKSEKLFVQRININGTKATFDALDTLKELETAVEIRDEFYEDYEFYDNIEDAIEEWDE